MKVGFIGVGSIGNPMAGQLLRAGHQLTVHDVRHENAASLLTAGATWADSPAAVAAGVLHVGAIGCGSVCKIMHNCASFTLDLTMAECWTVGVKAGVAPETIVDVFKNAALGNMMSLKVRLPATYLRGNFDPRFSLKLARKDLGLALELARANDTPMRLGALCEQELVEAMARGWAERDASIFLTLQEERAKVQVRV